MSLDSESYVIGAAIKDQTGMDKLVEVFGEQNPMSDAKHRAIYTAMLALFRANKHTDLTSVCNQLREDGQIVFVGGSARIAEIVEGVGATAFTNQNAKTVFDAFTIRRLSEAAALILEWCKQGGNAQEITEKAVNAVLNVQEASIKGGLTPALSALDELMASIEPEAKRRVVAPSSAVMGAMLGGGYAPGEVVCYAARTSQGKSIAVTGEAVKAALVQGQIVAMFPLEMSRREIASRAISMLSLVRLNDIRTNNLTPSMRVEIARAATTIGGSGLYLDDTAVQTVSEMQAKCRRLKREKGLSLVVIDYLGLIRAHTTKNSTEVTEIGGVMKELKAMAKNLDVPVIIAAQLNRGAEDRNESKKDDNKRPKLVDLRGSGHIEQDCDIVILMYHPHRESDKNLGHEVEMIIAKQRNGPTGTVVLSTDAEHVRFYERKALPI